MPLVPLLIGIALASSSPAAERNFYNTIAPNGADPWVYRHTDGMYYLTATTGTNVTL